MGMGGWCGCAGALDKLSEGLPCSRARQSFRVKSFVSP